MANVKREQLLFINSASRIGGSIGDFNVFLNDQMIRCDDFDSTIKVSVIHFSCNRSYYTVEENVTSTLNNITLDTSTTYTITSGYYDVYTFKNYLLTILTGWTITYNKSTNTYTFIPPPNVWQFVFYNSGNLFGFPQNYTTLYFVTLNPLISALPILMNQDTSLFIRTDIPRQRYSCLDNLNSENFTESDILAAIPVNFAPFNTISISDSNQFSFYMSNRFLNVFRLNITDQNGVQIPLKWDYTIGLKFEYIENRATDESLETL